MRDIATAAPCPIARRTEAGKCEALSPQWEGHVFEAELASSLYL